MAIEIVDLPIKNSDLIVRSYVNVYQRVSIHLILSMSIIDQVSCLACPLWAGAGLVAPADPHRAQPGADFQAQKIIINSQYVDLYIIFLVFISQSNTQFLRY